jgi:serine protein kinase
MYNDSLFNAFARSFEARSQTEMSMAEYLESCRTDPMRYANTAERLLLSPSALQALATKPDIFGRRTVQCL